MFDNKDSTSNAVTIISEGCMGKGELREKGEVHIYGFWEGTINAEGKLTIGKSGKLKADIHANNMQIGGTVEGNTYVVNMLKIDNTANINGDIVVPKGKLNIDEGAYFNGNIQMKDE